MFSHKIFSLLAFATLSGLTLAQGNAVVNNQTTSALNITAIDGVNGSSVLQCWRLDDFAVSNTPGTEGALNLYLGNTSNASYTIIPARTNAGLHRAPAAQFVFFASGLIHLSLPNSTDEVWLQGGKYGLIFAADTADKSTYGHATEYPSDEATVSLQVPLEAGTELNHTVLHEGACTWTEQAGL